MSINNISGLNQYVNSQSSELAAPQNTGNSGDPMVQAQKRSSFYTDQGQNQDSGTLNSTQNAFKVDLTSKGRKMYAKGMSANNQGYSNGTGRASSANRASASGGTNMNTGNIAANNVNNSAGNSEAQQAQQLLNIIA